jgi:class 3 adenylate cyclase
MSDDRSMTGVPRTGFLVLADISGFTAFVTATELEHGPPLIAELLEQVIRAISPPLEVEGVEGDAVFALGLDGRVDPPARLLDVLEAGFRGFRAKQRELAADDSCTCGACCSVGKLSLKAVGHYGTFVEQTIGGRTLTAGRDVVLAHRLLKNGLRPEVDYALFTRSALERMNVQPERMGFLRHTERFEHFGDVECFVGSVAGA